jgi:hypothetical protein
MDIFVPSVILAVFPYIFMGIFPIVGLILVTKWVIEDFKRAARVKREVKYGKASNAPNQIMPNQIMPNQIMPNQIM